MSSPEEFRACDESGLCEDVEGAFASDRATDRLITVCAKWCALVDISPITPNHILICPREHVHSTRDVPSPSRFWGDVEAFAKQAAAAAGYEQFVLVEHGTRSDYCGPSCVRHVHVHVVLGHASRLMEAVEYYILNPMLQSKAGKALEEIAGIPSYMLVFSSSGEWIVGQPRSGVRQISREFLAMAFDARSVAIDWVVAAGGERHLAAVLGMKKAFSSLERFDPNIAESGT